MCRTISATRTVITPDTVCHLSASISYLWDRGARILVSAIDYTAEWDADALARLEAEYRRVARFYTRLLRERRAFHLEPFDSRISQLEGSLIHQTDGEGALVADPAV